MKFLRTISIASLLLLCQELQAQVAHGGTPKSFGSEFRAMQNADVPLSPYLIPRLDMEQVRREDAAAPNNRYAAATAVNITPQSAGKWQTLPNGDRLWRVALQAQNDEVFGMRLLFERFRLPAGGELYIYTADKQTVLGAFTHENNHESGVFATTLIRGREVIMEYYEPSWVKYTGEIFLNRIDQAYKSPFISKKKKGEKSGNSPQDFGDSGSCNLNINCTPLAADWQDEKRGVVRIHVVASNGSGWCSGSLINNTAQNNKPYILTANHCGANSTSTHLNQWVFDFHYDVDCNNPDAEPSAGQSITGATLRAKYANSDFFLVELNETIPPSYQPYFNGWDKTGNLPTASVCIHHPAGDAKKFSIDTDAPITSNYYANTSDANGTHIRVVWNNGTTEGGSSGSPLFNTSGQIIGQLHGGDAACSAANDPDWFGRLSASWNGGGTNDTRLSNWLDPNNTGVSTLDGKTIGNAADFTTSAKYAYYQNAPLTFTNTSLGTITDYNWNFGADASPATANTAGPHSVSYSTLGTKTITLGVNSNASTMTRSMAILPNGAMPYTLAGGGDFESNASDFANVTIKETAFERANSTIPGKDGTASGNFAWVLAPNDGAYPDNAHVLLYTPLYNLSSGGVYLLKFKTKFATEQYYDGFMVEYSTNKGASWTQLGTQTDANWYNALSKSTGNGFDTNTPIFTGTSSGFEAKSFDISFLAGNASVAFRFVFRSDYLSNSAGVAIDDFEVQNPFAPTTFSPAKGAIGVTVNANLTLTFPRPVSKGTGNVTIKRVSDLGVVETIALSSSNITVSGNVATIDPTNDLPSSTNLFVDVDNGAFKDANNVLYAGVSGSSGWNFTTVDNVPPVVTNFSPAHNATGATPTANLVASFNETLKKGTTGEIRLKKASDNSTVETFTLTSTQITFGGAGVTINPTIDLAWDTEYYVEIDNGFIQDLSNNVFAGFTGNGTWKFKTSQETTPPTVDLFDPLNGETAFPGARNLKVYFSEPIQRGTGSIIIRKLSDNSIVESFEASTSTRLSISSNTLTIDPTNDLAYNTEYFVTITAGCIKDLAGNNFAGFSNNTTWKFKTDFSTGIERATWAKDLTLFPNPTQGEITLLVKEGLSLQNVQLRVYDAAGKTHWQASLKQLVEKQSFDWQALPQGAYILEIRTAQGTATKTFLKQ